MGPLSFVIKRLSPAICSASSFMLVLAQRFWWAMLFCSKIAEILAQISSSPLPPKMIISYFEARALARAANFSAPQRLAEP